MIIIIIIVIMFIIIVIIIIIIIISGGRRYAQPPCWGCPYKSHLVYEQQWPEGPAIYIYIYIYMIIIILMLILLIIVVVIVIIVTVIVTVIIISLIILTIMICCHKVMKANRANWCHGRAIDSCARSRAVTIGSDPIALGCCGESAPL